MRYVSEVKPLPVYIGTLDVIRQPAKGNTMYQICYGYKEFGGSFYLTVENCNSFAEAEKLFLETQGKDLFIRAIEKL